MKPYFAAFIVFILGTTVCYAQKPIQPKSNALSFELGKNGLIYNLNYDRKPGTKNFGFRIGIGSNFAKNLNAITMGGGGYGLIGRSSHFLELGAEIQYLIVDEVSDDQKRFAFVYPDYSVKTLYPSLNLGYRRYSKTGLFRIGFSPGIIKSEFIPGGYISYGVIF